MKLVDMFKKGIYNLSLPLGRFTQKKDCLFSVKNSEPFEFLPKDRDKLWLTDMLNSVSLSLINSISFSSLYQLVNQSTNQL